MISIFVVCVIGFSFLGFIFGYQQYKQTGEQRGAFFWLRNTAVVVQAAYIIGTVVFAGVYAAVTSNAENVVGVIYIPAILLHGLGLIFSVSHKAYNQTAFTISFFTLLKTLVFLFAFYSSTWAWAYLGFAILVPLVVTCKLALF